MIKKKALKWDSISTGITAAAGMTGALTSGRQSVAGDMLSEGSKFASMGSVAGPWGTAVGGALGLGYGAIKGVAANNAYEEEYSKKQNVITRMNQNKVASLAQDPTFLHGDANGGIYKFGGQMGGHVGTDQLTELASGAFEVNGPSHEKGGVQLGQNNVEGGETISKGYVFSKELGFAQAHKPIAKRIGHLEERAPSPLRNKTLKSLKEREQELANTQEMVKQQLGLR